MQPNVEWMSATIELISTIGFPIFISLYLLQRMESKLDDVVKALQELSTVIKTAH